MTDTSMIEKVARAIAASRGVVIADEVDQALFQRDARAAIAAMREPTPEMDEAATGGSGGHYVVGDPSVVLGRMIDAALKD